jgi:hypothetical protein
MGLKACGTSGVKAIVKNVFHQACRQYDTLGDARKGVGVERAKTSVALDGNVMAMSVGGNCASFEAYTGAIFQSVKTALASAALVIVVFDEPEHLSVAKAEEQRRRDQARNKTTVLTSQDITTHPTNDDYTTADLEKLVDCHVVVRCRPARQRFFDEVCRNVLLKLRRTIDTWVEQGHDCVVLFDGIDPLGAQRPPNQPRRPQIFGSDPEIATLFQRDTHTGEGDLKLSLVEQRVKDLVLDDQLEADLHMSVTIDTDSIAISLLDAARRNCEPIPVQQVQGCLCMRERATKRDLEEDDQARASYFVVDYVHLYELLQAKMWGLTQNPTPLQQRKATALMCAGWALCGCDFVDLPGMNADLVLSVLPSLLKTAPELLDLMEHTWSGDREGALSVTQALRRLVLMCAGELSERPRARKTTVEKMRNHDSSVLQRAAWVSAYWTHREFSGAMHEFGFAGATSSLESGGFVS